MCCVKKRRWQSECIRVSSPRTGPRKGERELLSWVNFINEQKTSGAELQGYGTKARRLRELAHQLFAISSELEIRDGVQEAEALDLSSLLVTSAQEYASALDIALRQYRARRLREAVFEDRSLFGEPAWNILLVLYITERQGKRLPVKSACIGAAVPLTTAIRWIGILEQKGFVRRENDAADGRRSYLSLTTEGLARMTDYFARVKLATLGPDSALDAPAVSQD